MFIEKNSAFLWKISKCIWMNESLSDTTTRYNHGEQICLSFEWTPTWAGSHVGPAGSLIIPKCAAEEVKFNICFNGKRELLTPGEKTASVCRCHLLPPHVLNATHTHTELLPQRPGTWRSASVRVESRRTVGTASVRWAAARRGCCSPFLRTAGEMQSAYYNTHSAVFYSLPSCLFLSGLFYPSIHNPKDKRA